MYLALVKALKREQAAFSIVYKTYAGRILWLLNILLNKELAEDAVQNLFLKNSG